MSANATPAKTAAHRRAAEAQAAHARAGTARVHAWYAARDAGASDAEIAAAVGAARSTITKRIGSR